MQEQTPLATALELLEQGIQVFPARIGTNRPLIEWKKYQKEPVTDKAVAKWFHNHDDYNIWAMTGNMSGYVVIDLDSQRGFEWWLQKLGKQVLFSGAQVATRRGKHIWFKIPEGHTKAIPSWSLHDDESGVSFDFRADATGVIVPPSVHKSGHIYRWLVPLEFAADAPPTLLDGTFEKMASEEFRDEGSSTTGTGGVTRSMLTALLNNPPGDSGSGRNDWLARVAGHYAKSYHNQRDLYDVHCHQANMMMGTPLSDGEYKKTIESIWSGEHRRNNQRELDANCGWLKSAEYRILTQIQRVAQDGTKTMDLAEYANFDMVTKGVMLGEDQSRTYWVTIKRRSRHDPGKIDMIDTVVAGTTFGDNKKLQAWLAGFGCSILPPGQMYPREGSPGLRMQRYLDSQKPSEVTVTKVLGWDGSLPKGGGFVTHDGVIRADGISSAESSGVIADPVLKKGAAPHFYGFDKDLMEARRVLAELLTFHDDMVTSVFGAWWAACLLKPQIEANTSLFPFMAIQAPSESGKTNGFFSMMSQLNGNTRGEVQPTRAALRDMAAANRNGIVWVDDLDDPQYLMELLRAATSGGSLTKMGEDRESVKNTPIVAPIVISGESLGIENQKALIDRAISVPVPSPVGRRSAKDPARPQWDDILELRNQYPEGLSSLAGWYLTEALAVTPQVLSAVRAGRDGVSGRAGDKVAIVRAGARLLDYLVGQDEAARDAAWGGGGEHAQRVEEWVRVFEEGTVSSLENSMTLEILPWAIRTYGYHDKPIAGEHGRVDNPVYFKNYREKDQSTALTDSVEIWFNPDLLAESWFKSRHGRIQPRTQSAGAFKEQCKALDLPSKRVKITGSQGKLAYFRKLTGPIAAAVIERARGL